MSSPSTNPNYRNKKLQKKLKCNTYGVRCALCTLAAHLKNHQTKCIFFTSHKTAAAQKSHISTRQAIEKNAKQLQSVFVFVPLLFLFDFLHYSRATLL